MTKLSIVNTDEKRDFLRLSMDSSLAISRDGERQTFSGSVSNLSGSGILFTSRERFKLGTSLKLLLTPSSADLRPLKISAVVSRVVAKGQFFEIACETATIE